MTLLTLGSEVIFLFLLIVENLSAEILSSSVLKSSPQFVEDIQNATVTAGREAVLSCVVENLGDYRAGWLKVDSQTILTLQKRVVTHNSRISVTHDEHRTWNLHIKQVKESDRGCYMCQINTKVMKNKIGCLEVFVPPNIIDEKTSSETSINEKDTVTLTCNAEGYPTPELLWRREDRKDIRVASSGRDFLRVDKVKGDNLTLSTVTRDDMGAYLCIASNGVPPIVSKRIELNVNFAPLVKVDNQLIGTPLGTKVEVKCEVEAFPKAINYWTKGDDNEMLLQGTKYTVHENSTDYKSTLRLFIKDFSQEDEGSYKCVSKNSLGHAETAIRLYVITVPPPKNVNSYDQRKQSDLKLGGHRSQWEESEGGNSISNNHQDKNVRLQDKTKMKYEFDEKGSLGRKKSMFEQEGGYGSGAISIVYSSKFTVRFILFVYVLRLLG